MRCLSVQSLCRPLVSLLTRLAVSFHSTLSFDSPLSISCTLCNYFTALGYYPFNLLLYTLFATRSDGWQHCTDLMRYQLAILTLFLLYVLWRLTLSTAERRWRDGSLLLLVALQLWVDWHGWYASKQAIANFQSYVEADNEEWVGGRHTVIDHSTHSHTHSPVQPPPLTSTTAWPAHPYQLATQCGVGFTLHLVRLSLLNVAFTVAVAAAFLIRLATDWLSEDSKERVWAVYDAALHWSEQQWARLTRRARRARRQYQRRQQRQAGTAGWVRDAESDSEEEEEEEGELEFIDEEEGVQKQVDGRYGASARDRLLP